MEIIVRDENIEDALRRLKKVVSVDGILIQLKMRAIGHKHSDFIKMKRARAERTRLKRERRVNAGIARQAGRVQ